MPTQSPTYHKLLILFVIVASGLVSLWLFTKPSATKELPVVSTSTPTTLIATTTTSASVPKQTKTYRNEEFGFEFEYPKDWKLDENLLRGPFSKINLRGDASAKDYNPFNPIFLKGW